MTPTASQLLPVLAKRFNLLTQAIQKGSVRDVSSLSPSDTGVYVILNVINGKSYVGSSASSLAERIRWHKSMLKNDKHDNTHLQRAWNKYLSDGFTFLIVQLCTPEECVGYEQQWIDSLDASDRSKGYNKCPKAANSLGVKLPPLTEEHKNKIKAFQKELWTPEARKIAGEFSSKRWTQEGSKEDHQEWLKRLWDDPEHREKMSVKSRERWQDQEYRDNLSRHRKEHWADPEKKAKNIAAIKKIRSTAVSKEKTSEATAKLWEDEETREKFLAHRRSEENRKRLSELHKALWADPDYRAKILASRAAKAAQKQGATCNA